MATEAAVKLDMAEPMDLRNPVRVVAVATVATVAVVEVV